MLVEGAGLLRLAVHQQPAAADLVAQRGDATHDVDEQRRTESAPLVVAVDAQPRDTSIGSGALANATADFSPAAGSIP